MGSLNMGPALELGYNIITDKAMAIDIPRALSIFLAVEQFAKMYSSR